MGTIFIYPTLGQMDKKIGNDTETDNFILDFGV